MSLTTLVPVHVLDLVVPVPTSNYIQVPVLHLLVGTATCCCLTPLTSTWPREGATARRVADADAVPRAHEAIYIY